MAKFEVYYVLASELEHFENGVRFCLGIQSTVTLIEWIKIARLFLHVTSKLFNFTVLNLSW